MVYTFIELLILHNISIKDAAEIFGRSERTIKSWNHNPPPFAVQWLETLSKKPPFPHQWKDWYFDREFLVDNDGNHYSIDEIRSIFYTRQLVKSLTGSKNDVVSLKSYLEQQKNKFNKTISISVDDHKIGVFDLRKLK